MGRRNNYAATQKAAIVLHVLAKQVMIAEACRRHGITEASFNRWREQALAAMERGLEGPQRQRARGRAREGDCRAR